MLETYPNILEKTEDVRRRLVDMEVESSMQVDKINDLKKSLEL